MNISTAGVRKRGLPTSFVYIDELIADCVVDAKYCGTDNFVGRGIDGYKSPLVIMSRETAESCVKAANILRGHGFLLKIFDSYRPRRAIDDFARWCSDDSYIRRKPIHYPELGKADLFRLGYISDRSMHTRGAAVDLTIIDMKTHQELDMGSIFDFMGARSHFGAGGLTEYQKNNRLILRNAMLQCGFKPHEKEWWHFNLINEPYPDDNFDFPVA